MFEKTAFNLLIALLWIASPSLAQTGKLPSVKEVRRTGSITGKVVFEDGRPAKGILVSASMQWDSLIALEKKYYGRQIFGWMPEEFAPTPIRMRSGGTPAPGMAALTKADGSYRLIRLTNAIYDVSARDDGFSRDWEGEWTSVPVENIAAHEDKEVNLPPLVLTHGATIRASVVDAATNKPLPDVLVSYRSARYSTQRYDARADETGSCFFRVLPGKAALSIFATGQRKIAQTKLSPNEKAAMMAKWNADGRASLPVVKVGTFYYAVQDWVQVDNDRFKLDTGEGPYHAYEIETKTGDAIEVTFRLRNIDAELPNKVR